MLTKYFPTTKAGASIYGGFMIDGKFFCRTFEMEETLEKTLNTINDFLDNNGYEKILTEQLNEEYSFKEYPVSLSKHGYQEEMVLIIERDNFSVEQDKFITNELLKFRNERDWEQFHNSKDLALAITIESAELLELFLWKNPEEADKDKVKEELADVFAFAYLLADKYKLDVEQIVLEKIKKNEEKYPVEKAKGTAKKYDEL